MDVVRSQQDYDFNDAGLNDIRFNFLIGARNEIFEGRGWDILQEPVPGYFDNNTLTIGFLTDNLNKGPEFLNATLTKLIEDGKAIGKITKAVRLNCELTLCPPAPFSDRHPRF